MFFTLSLLIIDEAHNFVSRIVNKIPKNATAAAIAAAKKTVSYMMYEYLMDAKNARVILLTGTPIINYPNEIGILFNILRGYIKSWAFTINVKTSEKIIEIVYDLIRVFLPLYFIGYLGIYKSKFAKNRSSNLNANILFGLGSMTILTYLDMIKKYILDPNYFRSGSLQLDNINLFVGLFLFLIFGFLPIIIGMFLILKNNKE